MAAITKPQKAKIWAMARELSLDKETLYSIVYRETSSDSISDLTKEQGIDLIDTLVSMKESTSRPGMATKKQVWLINDLAAKLGWDQPKQIRGFIRKYAKVEDAKWLTADMASKIINGLKAIYERETKKNGHKAQGE